MPLDQSVHQRFSSRAGLLLSALGIAVGTGNIWRFPRIAAQNGGDEGAGALIIAWIIFLFLWSIPLIIAEYFIGKKHRSGVISSFAKGMGQRFAWMGAFVAFVATAISFFYAIIVGWALYYFFQMLVNPLPSDSTASLALWDNFQDGYFPFLTHIIVVIVGILAISRGVKSIEKVNKILIPTLIVIILIAVIRAITLPGAGDGIAYLFRPQWSQLKDPNIWLQALTQNAWDTGAGWGLFLTYAAYMKMEHGSVKNAFITGIGNNVISLLMAIMIFGTVFSVMQAGMGYSDGEVLEVMRNSGPASTGLTFIWLPQLFGMMSFGKPLAVLFFLGLAFAGFSSLISMFELTTRVLVDKGVKRKKALWIVVGAAYVLGIPSAMSLDILANQDFVWGLGLIISGVFIAIHALKYGLDKFKSSDLLAETDWKAGKWWELLLRYFIPLAGTILLLWWMYLSATEFAPDNWYNPLNPYSVMTCVLQWGVVSALFIYYNRKYSL
ncbi:MAG: sodium-dependent transporter [Bacteroidales bacterium]|nr:sodium-dependent transporter [Bacteroidales bacterium]MCF8390683.1 sodium-dependent transporter [Bacteroidales bacterium]